MIDERERKRRPWPTTCSGCLVALVAFVVLACGSFGIATRRGVVAPPSFDVALGGYTISAAKTAVPDCLPIEGCLPITTEANKRWYAVWVVRSETLRQPNQHIRKRRLLAIPLPDQTPNSP